MRLTIAVVNQKGGTGKTTTVANLAWLFAAAGKRVLAVDCDPQASLTFYFGRDERAHEGERKTLYWALLGDRSIEDILIDGNPALIPASITLAKADAELVAEPGASWVLKEKLAPLRDRFDIALIDCPPTLTLLTVNALAAADAVLVPVKTDLLSTLGVPQLLDTVHKVQRRANPSLQVMGILPTLHNPRFAHDVEVLDEIRSVFGKQLRVFEAIPRATSFDRAAGTGKPTVAVDPTSTGALAYQVLAKAILESADG